ncbi:acetate/propionate family kinase [Simiduia litorea]|uniref:hypothetical protein n=1 Tax=Simiduia litorea TaxID=1435348 RepID=UPI0036F2FA7E
MENECFLLCNTGSSSIKLALASFEQGVFNQVNVELTDVGLIEALQGFLADLPSLSGVLHRIVHMGEAEEGPLAVTASSLQRISHWASLAPLHNYQALDVIEIITRRFGDLPQWLFSDSGLYRNLSALRKLVPLPQSLSTDWPLQRYGFHGLAHRNMWRQLPSSLRAKKVITLQLGSGCSATAWDKGEALENSMGFSPLDGLCMRSRSGNVDPGVLLHLLSNAEFGVEALNHLLTQGAGLKGISGLSGDMRELLQSHDERAQLAVDYFCDAVTRVIGAQMVTMGGIDGICFGGGVGENQPAIRAKILAPLLAFGADLAPELNGKNAAFRQLNKTGSCMIYLTPVNEMQEMFGQYTEKFRPQR